MKTAVLIGGHCDLTKMMVEDGLSVVQAHKPLNSRSVLMNDINRLPPEEPVMCEVLTYVLCADTPSGVLIYELEES